MITQELLNRKGRARVQHNVQHKIIYILVLRWGIIIVHQIPIWINCWIWIFRNDNNVPECNETTEEEM